MSPDPPAGESGAGMRQQLLHKLVRPRRPVTGFSGSWSGDFKADEDGRLDVRGLGGSPSGIYD